MSTILVVEDNEDIGVGLRDNLEAEGYDVDVARAGMAGLASARERRPDLVILDLGLPDIDGHQVLRLLRRENYDCPVLLLTARDAQAEKVLGFRMGADDYVTKPFGMLELLARVEALLRRAGGRARTNGVTPEAAPAAGANGSGAELANPADIVRFGSVEVNRATHIVQRDGREVPLAPKEYDLLIALLDRNGAVVPRGDLLRDVWGYSPLVSSRTVDSHIAQLRRKLEADPGAPAHILTVLKSGYRLRW